MSVPGVVVARNLTPDAKTGKGYWTGGELVPAIREGVDKDGEALFPMMPYRYFRSVEDEDVRSIVVYSARSSPCAIRCRRASWKPWGRWGARRTAPYSWHC